MSKDVLDRLDEAAQEAGRSRSALLSEAVKAFLDEKEERQRLEQRRKAARRITQIADEIGPWDATAEVTKWRESH
jgi:metal-responsive CopG/Arc/MetJ family transcriptional regulator